MANTYYYLDDNEKALEVAEKGLDIDSDCADLWVRKAGIYYLYDFSEFKRCLEMAVKLEPNNIKNYITLIRQCLWQDEEDNARMYYEKLIFYNPAFSESFDEVTEITRILKEKILVYSIY
jgi:tetratricopeptide (TPR) repeat protein